MYEHTIASLVSWTHWRRFVKFCSSFSLTDLSCIIGFHSSGSSNFREATYSYFFMKTVLLLTLNKSLSFSTLFCEKMLFYNTSSKHPPSLPHKTIKSLSNITFSDKDRKIIQNPIRIKLMDMLWSTLACSKYVVLLSIDHLKSVTKHV